MRIKEWVHLHTYYTIKPNVMLLPLNAPSAASKRFGKNIHPASWDSLSLICPEQMTAKNRSLIIYLYMLILCVRGGKFTYFGWTNKLVKRTSFSESEWDSFTGFTSRQLFLYPSQWRSFEARMRFIRFFAKRTYRNLITSGRYLSCFIIIYGHLIWSNEKLGNCIQKQQHRPNYTQSSRVSWNFAMHA